MFIFIIYFSIVVPLNSCVLSSVGLSSLKRHFQQVFYGVEISCVSCRINDKRPTGKKKILEWDDGGKIGNKNK